MGVLFFFQFFRFYKLLIKPLLKVFVKRFESAQMFFCVIFTFIAVMGDKSKEISNEIIWTVLSQSQNLNGENVRY